jgi:hypothetical protein
MKKLQLAVISQIIICSLILLLPRTGAAFGYDVDKHFEKANITFPAPESLQQAKYFGLSSVKPFKVNDIKAKIVVVEIMSALCEYCSLNAGKMNEIYNTIEQNPQLAPQVKFLAIGIGNSSSQLNAFKQQHKVAFPMLNDTTGVSMAMGDLPTPTTLIVSCATGKVLDSHVGLIWSADGFAGKIADLANKN